MPKLRYYNIFISHSWTYDEFSRLIAFLREAKLFNFRDYSVNSENPVPAADVKELSEKLSNRIRLSHIVLIPAGMEINYSESIQLEIEIALRFNKPIVAVIPLGQKRVPKITQSFEDTVYWRRKSIVQSIRKHAL